MIEMSAHEMNLNQVEYMLNANVVNITMEIIIFIIDLISKFAFFPFIFRDSCFRIFVVVSCFFLPESEKRKILVKYVKFIAAYYLSIIYSTKCMNFLSPIILCLYALSVKE